VTRERGADRRARPCVVGLLASAYPAGYPLLVTCATGLLTSYKQQSTSLSPYFPFSDGGLLASFSTRLPFAIPRVRTDSYQKAVDLGPILAYQITLQIQISIPGQRINSTVQSPDCAHK